MHTASPSPTYLQYMNGVQLVMVACVCGTPWLTSAFMASSSFGSWPLVVSSVMCFSLSWYFRLHQSGPHKQLGVNTCTYDKSM